MRISRSTRITTLVVVCALVVAALLRNGARATTTDSGAGARASVEVLRVERRSLPGEVRAGGFLRARQDVTLAAERAGRVVELPVAEGAAVKAGAVVARLDDTIAAQNLGRARVAAREAALSPNLSAADLSRARADLALAEHEWTLHHPVAPIDGVVEVHHVDVGEYVRQGQPLVDVVDAATTILDVDVDGEVAVQLRTDQSVRVLVTGLGDGEGQVGRITRVAGRADPSTRRFRVEVELPGAAGRPGMHAEARFSVPGGKPALFLPKAAVRFARGENGVFAVRDGKARWIHVDVREVYHRPDLWRVKAGALRNGEEIVLRGYSGLRDGADVEVAAKARQ